MEEISPTKRNILQYLDYKGISKADFCRQTGFSYENFKGKSLKSDIGGAVLGKIITIYSDISPEWLLTGSGSMTRSNVASVPPDETPDESPNAALNTLKGIIKEQALDIARLELEVSTLKKRLENG
jgi:hypothetical protein